MKTINIKIIRDLKSMRGQVIAIGFVIVAGVSVYVTMTSVSNTLQRTLQLYYAEYAFADGFASIRRAPNAAGERLREIAGINEVETRVSAIVNLEIADFADPVMGLIVSLPEEGRPQLNRLYMRQGRMPDPEREGEAALHEAFARAHGLEPGDQLSAVIGGRRRALTVVGIALSPEFLYQVQPGSLFPDPERFGVLWMSRGGLEAAYGMTGAFNDVSFTLAPGASVRDVLDRVDLLLRPYGGQGAYARADHMSHSLISEELNQLEAVAFLLPLIMLSVAAFLLNIVVARLITLQREQIAVLKAFGYSDLAVATHYVKMVLVVAVFGALAGTALAVWMGSALAELYLEYFHFPFLDHRLDATVVVTAVALAGGAAVVGAALSARRALSLAPAEAMRPAPPPSYRTTLLERFGLRKHFDQSTRIILRNIERQWLKASITVLGIAAACGILVMGLFWGDAFRHIVRIQFGIAQREDLTVTFTEPTSASAIHELAALPGVHYAEPFRIFAVRLKNGHRWYDAAIEGIPVEAYLRRVIDPSLKPVQIPAHGLMLTTTLAEILDVRPGEQLAVEVMTGRRYERSVVVSGVAEQFLGVGAYMSLDAANRLAGDGDAVSGAYLLIDSRYEQQLNRALQDRPRVASITARDRMVESYMSVAAETLLVFTVILSLFAGVIALGVIYNSVRISLSERDRELASMRVLGFTRGEVSYILLGETALLVLAAIPVGLAIGAGLSALSAQSLQTEMYRIPVVLTRGTFALSAAVVLVSTLLSTVLVRRRLHRLDLIGVLKTRE
ncbi:MAG: FtsX-like permease family protein [Spirochaetaceae bacterium]|nr:MAG: FtsX-like permease family protein [Spirochaetaceae bacterium]